MQTAATYEFDMTSFSWLVISLRSLQLKIISLQILRLLANVFTTTIRHGSSTFLRDRPHNAIASDEGEWDQNSPKISSSKRCPVLWEFETGRNPSTFNGPVLDQQKDVSLSFRRDESRCCAGGKTVSSKNKDTSFCWSRTEPMYRTTSSVCGQSVTLIALCICYVKFNPRKSQKRVGPRLPPVRSISIPSAIYLLRTHTQAPFVNFRHSSLIATSKWIPKDHKRGSGRN